MLGHLVVHLAAGPVVGAVGGGIVVDRNEGVGVDAVGDGGPERQAGLDVGAFRSFGPREPHLAGRRDGRSVEDLAGLPVDGVGGIQQVAGPAGDVEVDLFFDEAGWPDRTDVRSAVAGVDDDDGVGERHARRQRPWSGRG